jgi:predicted nucleotidyltransferase
MGTLTQKRVKKILKEFKKGIKNTLRGKFVELILFGSYARGDYEFGSDIDVLLLVREKLTKEEDKKISELSSAISLEYDMVITCFDCLLRDFKHRNSPFLLNIRREGEKI